MRGTVLVVDDRARPRRALANELEDAGFRVLQASDGVEAWSVFCRAQPDVVLTDVVMPRSDGLDLLSRVRSRSDVPVILFTARGSVESAASAFKTGAYDFLSSPEVDIEELVALVSDAMQGSRPAEELPDLERRLVGSSRAMTRVRARVSGLAPLRTPVLVSGEPGTGRDTVVRAIHDLGATSGTRFERIDSGEFSPPGDVPESGAVYLDGVEKLSPPAQAYWAARVTKAAAHEFRKDPRILASTTDSLLARVDEGHFHRGLGRALLRFSLELPPLRSLGEDVAQIADSLVEKIGASVGRKIRLSPAARNVLETKRWPGNVRQLEEILERAIAFSRGRQIRREVVMEVMAEQEQSLASIREHHSLLERDALMRAIQKTGGNVSQTALILGRSRSAVYRLIDKHGIPLRRSR